MSICRRISAVFLQGIARYWVMVIWCLVTAGVFIQSFLHYKNENKFYYLRNILGMGLSVSRASASVLNMSCLLIVLPTCRALTRAVFGPFPRSIWRPVADNPKRCHFILVYTIIVATCIHSTSHIINAINYSQHYSSVYPTINVAAYRDQNPFLVLATSFPGVTGLVMCLLLLLLWVTSLSAVRRSCYEVFQYSHYAALIFLIILIIHPMGGVLKQQGNLEEHPPGCFFIKNITKVQQQLSSHLNRDINKMQFPVSIYINSSKDIYRLKELDLSVEVSGVKKSESDPNNLTQRKVSRHHDRQVTLCHQQPKFHSIQSYTWVWIGVALAIWMVERLIRYCVSRDEVVVLSAVLHPCQILQLTLYKPNIKSSPGQFILLNCPEISEHEWHPFTIAVIEDGGIFSLYIRTDGNWGTDLVYNLCNNSFFSSRPILEIYRGTPHMFDELDKNSPLNSQFYPKHQDQPTVPIIIPHKHYNNNKSTVIAMCSESILYNDKLAESLPEMQATQDSQNLSINYSIQRVEQSKVEPQSNYIKVLENNNVHLKNLPLDPSSIFVSHQPNIRLQLTGPYCSPHQCITTYPVVIAIVGGIGITPVIAAMSEFKRNTTSPRRIHLVWVVRDASLFLTFASYLSSFIQDCWTNHLEDRFELKLHVTKPMPEKLPLIFKDYNPLISSRLSYGRPDWNILFNHWKEAYSKSKVGVFACGPKTLTRQINKYCVQATTQGYKFTYHHESFS